MQQFALNHYDHLICYDTISGSCFARTAITANSKQAQQAQQTFVVVVVFRFRVQQICQHQVMLVISKQ